MLTLPSGEPESLGLLGRARTRLQEGIERRRAQQAILRHGVWFIDIPRTSSSSVRYSLSSVFGWPYGKRNVFESQLATDQIFGDHLTVREMITLFGEPAWRRLRRFTIVRNPFERVESMYWYQLKARQIHPSLDFNAYVRCIHEAFIEVEQWGFLGYRKLWMPALDYLRLPDGGLDDVAILRFESRDADLEAFFGSLGIALPEPEHIQSSRPPRTSYRDAYSAESRRLVEEIYRQDLEHFGYRF